MRWKLLASAEIWKIGSKISLDEKGQRVDTEGLLLFETQDPQDSTITCARKVHRIQRYVLCLRSWDPRHPTSLGSCDNAALTGSKIPKILGKNRIKYPRFYKIPNVGPRIRGSRNPHLFLEYWYISAN